MVQINFALKEVSCKVVYYGPGLSGKTTNLQIIHTKMPAEHKGKMTSIATEGERTLFFDFLPLDLGAVSGMRTKFQLYTVPGQVYYNATRKLVLKGVDGVVFVADSQPDKMAENLQSWQNLIDNLAEHGLTLEDVPVVFQYNKRDLPNAVPKALMDDRLNPHGAPVFEAVASQGEGVTATLRGIANLVLDRLNQRQGAAHGTRPVEVKAARETGPVVAAMETAVAATVAPDPPAPPRRAVDHTAPTPPPPDLRRPRTAPQSAAVASAMADLHRDVGPERPLSRFPDPPPPDRRTNRAPRALQTGPPEPPGPPPLVAARKSRASSLGGLAPVEESLGSGARPGAPRRRSRAWIAVAAGALVAVTAALAAFFVLFRG
jgi:signal recognition particle receptor subunit beta